METLGLNEPPNNEQDKPCEQCGKYKMPDNFSMEFAVDHAEEYCQCSVADDPAESQEDGAEQDLSDAPGDINVPEGYETVGSVSYPDEAADIVFEDLLRTCHIDKIDGVSVTLDRPFYESKHGTLRVRIIHDHHGRAFIFRRDFEDEGRTNFKVQFSHQ